MKIMCKIPQYTHKNMKGFCHFSRKDTHRFTFSNHSLQLEKIPRTPKHVKSKEKHTFVKNIFQKSVSYNPTILQMEDSFFFNACVYICISAYYNCFSLYDKIVGL